MSDVVEKTFAALPKIFSETLLLGQNSGLDKQKLSPGLGPCYQNFVRMLHKCRTKNEENLFCKAQITDVKEQLENPAKFKDREKDLLFVCVYCHMLGYDVGFAKMTALMLLGGARDPYDMKFGCQTANLLFEREDEVSLLAVSSMVKNLKSSNLLEVYNVMELVAHFIQPGIIQVVLPFIQDGPLKHPRPLVRAKAVMCLYQYYLKLPELFQYATDSFYKSLSDPDPSVMAAACQIIYQLVKVNDGKHSGLVPVMVNILRQVIERRLPNSYEYHGIPSPWLQIRILKILALLGAGNQRQSFLIYPVLQLVFERTGLKGKMSYAICYECIVTCTTVYPSQQLLHTAAKMVGNFLRSKDISLKYIGIKALTGLVQVSQEFALQYQMVVVELLDHPDHTIQRKTVILLYSMTNSVNVQAVCDKLLQHLISSNDSFYRQDLIHKSLKIVQKFFKAEIWCAEILFKIIYLSSTVSGSKVLSNVLSIIKLGIPVNTEFCQCLVKKSVEYLFNASSSADIIRLSAWVLGKNSALLKNMPKDKLLLLFTKHLSRPQMDTTTKFWLITSLIKLINSDVLTGDVYTVPVEQLILGEGCVIIKEKLQELLRIGKLSKQIHPEKKEKRDFTLSFLDKHVADCLQNGSGPYKPKHMRFKQTEVEKDLTELFKGIQEQDMSVKSSKCDEVSSSGSTSLSKSDSVSKLPSVRRLWGKEGRIQDDKDDIILTETESQDSEKQQMINALFSGISAGKIKTVEKLEVESDPFFTDEDSCNIKSHQSSSTTDSGGWRQLHKMSSADKDSDCTLSTDKSVEALKDKTPQGISCSDFGKIEQGNDSLYDDFLEENHSNKSCPNSSGNSITQLFDDTVS